MAPNDLAVLTAQFDRVPPAAKPGWAMRISGTAQNIQHRAVPFVARVGEQNVEQVSVNYKGDRFEGLLRNVPRSGDRLFIGYAQANIPTSIVFQNGGTGPAVA
jgi:hypothetical protein